MTGSPAINLASHVHTPLCSAWRDISPADESNQHGSSSRTSSCKSVTSRPSATAKHAHEMLTLAYSVQVIRSTFMAPAEAGTGKSEFWLVVRRGRMQTRARVEEYMTK